MMPQSQEKYTSIRIKVANNMSKMVSMVYIMELVILALTSFFSVSKGTEYICMVFDATARRLKDSLWNSKCMLP